MCTNPYLSLILFLYFSSSISLPLFMYIYIFYHYHHVQVTSLRRDLRVAFEERDDKIHRVRELEEFKLKSEGQLQKLQSLSDQVSSLQSQLDEQTSVATRLKAEATTSERNHAMRTGIPLPISYIVGDCQRCWPLARLSCPP